MHVHRSFKIITTVGLLTWNHQCEPDRPPRSEHRHRWKATHTPAGALWLWAAAEPGFWTGSSSVFTQPHSGCWLLVCRLCGSDAWTFALNQACSGKGLLIRHPFKVGTHLLPLRLNTYTPPQRLASVHRVWFPKVVRLSVVHRRSLSATYTVWTCSFVSVAALYISNSFRVSHPGVACFFFF